jgi:hypothetical protein
LERVYFAHWLLFLATRWIWNLYRDNCLDVINVIVSVISIAVIVYFGVEIKGMLWLNLIGVLLLEQALNADIRSSVQGCQRTGEQLSINQYNLCYQCTIEHWHTSS